MSDNNIIPLPVGDARELREGRELPDRDDDEIMRLVRAGNRPAFRVLVERHMSKLMGFCIKMTGDRRAGEDLAQESWLEVWAHRDSYHPRGKFSPFLYTIARNRCRNHLRSLRRRGRYQADFFLAEKQAVADQPSHLDSLLREERKKRLFDGIGMLSPKLREALLLRFSQELDYDEIAQIVGRSSSTVRSRVFHALRKLRSQERGAGE